MQIITSKENEQIKHIKKLKDKKYRNMSNQYMIEGIKLVKESIQEKADIKTVVICDGCDKDGTFDPKLMYEIAKLNCIAVPEKLFKDLTDVENPQGILAVVEKQVKENQIDYNEDLIVILDNIQDPGNLGAILRTVDSANLKQIIVSKGTVDAFSNKVVRSTMGAIFRLNIIESENLEKTIKDLKAHKFQVVGTALETDTTIYDINYKKTAIIIGNEANGIEPEILEQVDKKIKIPMLGKTESLNASVATGIVVYEYVRRNIPQAL